LQSGMRRFSPAIRRADMMLSNLPPASDPLVRRVAECLRNHELLVPGTSALLAVSGGADSVALALVFQALAPELHLSLRIAHIHHGLRGSEADEDARWVAEFAAALNVPCDVVYVDVPALKQKERGSTEDIARMARYRELKRIKLAHGMDVLATAHHIDDQAETVVHHLLRGSGITGLGGMPWKTGEGHIRPLLELSRKEIRDWLRGWDMPWREDSSNASLTFARNRIRHELLPLLQKEWNPEISRTLYRLADVARAEDEALEMWAEKALDDALLSKTRDLVLLDIPCLKRYPLGLRRRVYRRAALGLSSIDAPLSYAETAALDRLHERRAQVSFRRRFRAWSTRSHVALESFDAWRGPTELLPGTRTEVPSWGVFVVTTAAGHFALPGTDSQCQASFAAGGLAMPLHVRRWRAGDRVQWGGSEKLVADLLRERKGNADPRTAVVVCDSRRVVWVPDLGGIRATEKKDTNYVTIIRESWRA